jgi:hypothetical protein
MHPCELGMMEDEKKGVLKGTLRSFKAWLRPPFKRNINTFNKENLFV